MDAYKRLLTVSAWCGNLILTGLAFYLAWKHSGPLTPVTFFTLALCILMGNALPLAAHLINLWWEEARLRSEEQIASLTVRNAVVRLEAAESRLHEVHDATSKAVLLARQVPDRIQERTAQLLTALEGFDRTTLERAAHAWSEALSAIGLEQERVVELQELLQDNLEFARAYETRLAEQQAHQLVDRIHQLEAEIGELRSARKSGNRGRRHATTAETVEGLGSEESGGGGEPSGAAEVTVDEDGGAYTVVDQAPDDAAEQISGGTLGASGPDQAADNGVDGADHEPNDEAPDGGNLGDHGQDDPELGESANDLLDNVSTAPVASAATTAPRQTDWADLLSPTPKPPVTLPADEIELEVHAMIGILNKLHLRGAPPHLSWERGTPLQLTGIGEYRWAVAGVSQPIECQLYINDQKGARGEPIVLQPGVRTVVRPAWD
jgi:HPt (histidine-containing phosphotransfer) domain-containing protein